MPLFSPTPCALLVPRHHAPPPLRPPITIAQWPVPSISGRPPLPCPLLAIRCLARRAPAPTTSGRRSGRAHVTPEGRHNNCAETDGTRSAGRAAAPPSRIRTLKGTDKRSVSVCFFVAAHSSATAPTPVAVSTLATLPHTHAGSSLMCGICETRGGLRASPAARFTVA